MTYKRICKKCKKVFYIDNFHNTNFVCYNCKPKLESLPCGCGCGQLAKCGRRFINGHNRKGKKAMQETREKQSKARKGKTKEEYEFLRIIGEKNSAHYKGKTWEDRLGKENAKIAKNKLSKSKKGKKSHEMTNIIKGKISNTLLQGYKEGKIIHPSKMDPNFGNKISLGLIGHEVSEQQIEKQRKSLNLFYKNNIEAKERCRKNALNNLATGKYPQTNTLPHKLLREVMKKEGIWDTCDFCDEVTIGFWSCDIASKKLQLAIPVDGDYWHCNPLKYPNGPINKTQKEKLKHDKAFDTYCENRGWKVLRFWEYDIKNNVENCLVAIKKQIGNLQ